MSAQNGCRLCRTIISTLKAPFRPDSKLFYFLDGDTFSDEKNKDMPYFLYIRCMKLYLSPEMTKRSGSLLKMKRVRALFVIRSPSLNFLDLQQYLPHTIGNSQSNTSSSTSLQHVSRWMSQCLQDHSDCNKGRTDWWPTRLIHISDNPSQPMIQLIETLETQPSGRYVALSHRWGSARFLQLTQENLKEMKRGIALRDLPKTFRDAIMITRQLGSNYLWIDSVCIVQNSKVDWQREAGRMAEVYQNAYCTISAAGANGANDGLFFERDVSSVLPLKAHTDRRTGLGRTRRHHFYFYDNAAWQRFFSDSPLSSRGWILQERILSPRIIHFGRQQLLWECLSHGACESFPLGFPRNMTGRGYKNVKLGQQLYDDGSIDREQWKQWVEDYTRRNLTVEGDKEAAIAGIVELHGRLTNDTSTCGLWNKRLLSELLWRSAYGTGRYSEDIAAARRPKAYRAPSWSWLALDGELKMYKKIDGLTKYVSKIEDVHIQREPNEGGGSLAPIVKGCLRLRGVYTTGEWRVTSPSDVQIRIAGHQIGRDSDYEFQSSCDIQYQTSQEKITCVLLELQFYVGKIRGSGLILKQSGPPSKNEYRRAGYLAVQAYEDLALLLRSSSNYSASNFGSGASASRNDKSNLLGFARKFKDRWSKHSQQKLEVSSSLGSFPNSNWSYDEKQNFFEKLKSEDLKTEVFTII
jgi:hypothetical protein